MNISAWFLFSVNSLVTAGAASDPQEQPDSQKAPGEAVTDEVKAGPAGELVLGVAVAQWRGDPRPTPGLGPTHLLAGRTDQAPGVQPGVLIRPQADLAGTRSVSVSVHGCGVV